MVTITAKAGQSWGDSPAATRTLGSASYAIGSRVLVHASGLRNNHTDGLQAGWQDPTTSASANAITWTRLAYTPVSTAAGAAYGSDAVVWISSVLTATESFTITLDAHSGASEFYYCGHSFEVLGASSELNQAAATVHTDAASASVSLGSAPVGTQLLLAGFLYNDGSNGGSWNAAPTNFTAVSGAAVTPVGATTVNAAVSTTDDGSATWGHSGTGAFATSLILLDLAPAAYIANFTLTGSPTTYAASKTVDITWEAGDIVVVGITTANGEMNISSVTATGLTFDLEENSAGTASTTDVMLYSEVAAAGGSQTLTVAVTGNTDPWSFGVWIVRGSGGVGLSSSGGTSSSGTDTSRTLTPAAGDLVLIIESDWQAAAAGQTLTTASGERAIRANAQVTGAYTYLYGDWTNVDAGSQTFGSASYTGRVCSTAAIIILAPSGAAREQSGFRWGNDDGSESAHGWAAAEDTDLVSALGTKLLRVQVDTDLDTDSAAYTLRYQKNGTGGYVAVPLVGSAEVTPVIEAGDTTSSGSNLTTPTSPWAVSTPAVATGDLLVMVIGWDDSVNNTGVTVANGPNGEVWSQIGSVVASNGTEVRLTAYWVVATGTWGAGSINVTPNANEQWTATVIKVLAGEFDAGTPIGASATLASTGTAETSVLNPDLSVGSTDGGGKLVWAGCVDADPLVTLSAGYTSIANNDRGNVALGVAVRDAAVTDSESVTDGTWSISSDSWCSIAFIVRAPTIANPVYISASANVTAGGEATTARLTAPTGKTTSDFVTGRRWDDENGTDTTDITTDDYTEFEWVLTTQAPAVASDYFDFRVYAGATPLDAYAVTPRWTIDPDTDVSAGEAAATATAQPPAAGVAPSAGEASATAAAHDATVSAVSGGKWGSVTHDFPGAAIDGTFWPGSYGTAPTVSGNKLSWGAGADYSGRATVGYDLTSSQVLIQYDPVTTGGYSGSHLKEETSDTNIAEITYDSTSGMLNAVISGANWSGSNSSNNVSLPASSLWVRYRHAAGTLYLEYSVSGASWTVLHSAATTGAMDTALADSKLLIECGPFGGAITSGPSFAKLNLPPAATDADAGEAQAAASAHQPAALVAPAAGEAAGTAAAQQPAVHVAPGPAQAAATATAHQPAVHVELRAGEAASTATAHDASVWIEANAGAAQATAAAQQPAASIAVHAATAEAALADAQPAAASIAAPAGEAQATAAAHDATGSSAVGGAAEIATSSATAWLASVELGVAAADAASTAEAQQPSVHVATGSGDAAATAAAHDATVQVAANAGEAQATASAHDAAAGIGATAGQATSTAAAHDPTVDNGAALVFTDDFNRADGGSLGANWTVVNGTIGIKTNQAYFGDDYGAGQLQRHRFNAVVDDDQYVTHVANGWSTGGYADVRMMARWSDAEPDRFYELRISNTASWWVNRVVDGTETDIFGADFAFTPALPEEWRLEVTGTNPVHLAVYRGGVLVDTYDDSHATRIQTGGQGGIGGFTTGSNSDVFIDDFEIGDLVVAATDANAGEAQATATAHDASVHVAATAITAESTATAHDATISADGETTAGEAAATAEAHQAAVSISAAAPTATAAATAHDAAVSVEQGNARFTDNFNRADSGSLGSPWVSVNGTMGISGNQAYFGDSFGAGETQRHRYDTALSGDDMATAVTITDLSNGGYSDARIMARWTGTNSFYELRVNNAGTWTVNRVTAGGEADIATGGVTLSLPETWRMEVRGTDPVVISVFRGGTLVSEFNDTAGNRIQTGARGGIGGYTAGGSPSDVTMDSFLTEVLWNAGVATGTATAHNAGVAVSANAGHATATATAENITSDGDVEGIANAEVATATATAHFDAGARISLNLIADQPIALSATAHDATVSTQSNVAATAGEATAAATAHDATVQTGNQATDADAGQAAATATAHDATTATTSTHEALAGDAAATATAHNATVQLGQRPVRLTATTTFFTPSFSARFTQPTQPIATTSIPAPTVRATATVTPVRVNATTTVFVPGVSMTASAPYFEATTTFFMPTPTEAQFVLVQVWNGIAWESGVLNVWDGSEWKPGSLRVWLAGGWQPS